MKKNLLFVSAVLIMIITACNNPFFPEKNGQGVTLFTEKEGQGITLDNSAPEVPVITIDQTDAECTELVLTQGEDAVLIVSVKGDEDDFSYQWYSNTENSNEGGTLIEGATDPDFKLPTDEPGTTYYYVVITNKRNGKTTTSKPVKVTVNENTPPAVYTIEIYISGEEPGDTLTVSPDSGSEGDTITLTYAVADTAFYNLIGFSGVTTAITSVNSAGSGERTYAVNAADVSNGVITIIAVFTHTDLELDPITFANDTEHIIKTYGDAAFTNAVAAEYNGNGAITYSSSDTTVATVDGSGQVTILKAGSAIITAEKSADAVYAYAQTNYKLTVEPKPVTITGLSASNKQYDGATTVTISGTAVINGLINGDTVTVSAGTASFENANIGNGKTVTFSGYSLSGADAGNYSLSTLPTMTANITVKSVTISVGAPNRTLIPFNSGSDTQYDTTATFTVTLSGLIGSDTVTVGLATNSYGLSLSNNTGIGSSGTVTITYNGTATVAQTSAVSTGLNISGNANYTLSGTPAVSAVIIDGQSASRAIPVTQSNITAFNTYANTTSGLTRHYKLTQNITLASNWTVINGSFTGSFDGQGYTISNPTTGNGMFSYIGAGGIIRNTGFIGVSVSHYSSSPLGNATYSGGVVGYNNGTVQNCYATGSVSGSGGYAGYGGGVVGYNYGTVQNCYATGSVSGSGGYAGYGGGVVGYNYGTVQNCYATGSVSGSGSSYAGYGGGVVGRNNSDSSTVRNCVALNPSVTSSTFVGRVVASNSGTLTNNYAQSSMTVKYSWNGSTGTNKTLDKGRAKEDGEDIYWALYHDQEFWSSTRMMGWDFTNVWQWSTSIQLPILRGVGGQ
jgi:hypothetical protein